MSTRSTTHFIDGNAKEPVAIIYRHSDGYPECAGKDLLRFLAECKKLKDSRFGDPSYLAAKYVVFLADIFNHHYDWKAKEPVEVRYESRLEFLSVGVLMEDPGDIEYRYIVDCSRSANGLPQVSCFHVHQNYETHKWSQEPVEIPTTSATAG